MNLLANTVIRYFLPHECPVMVMAESPEAVHYVLEEQERVTPGRIVLVGTWDELVQAVVCGVNPKRVMLVKRSDLDFIVHNPSSLERLFGAKVIGEVSYPGSEPVGEASALTEGMDLLLRLMERQKKQH